jgi:MFS family permease
LTGDVIGLIGWSECLIGRFGQGGLCVERNIKLYPWFQACRNLLFWQPVWFLYFQNQLSASEAIILAAVLDVSSSLLEVPSGYMADRFGRRPTLILALLATIAGALLLGLGGDFSWLLLGQFLLGAGIAFASGADSALLYDTLLETGREDEIAAQELKAWRYMFTGLALSAFLGGVMAMWSGAAAFLATALSGIAALAIAVQFREPGTAERPSGKRTALADGRALAGYFRQSTLTWLFAVAVSMYVFSHVPFVFAQPFIAEMLRGVGLSAETTLVSGSVIAAMMLVSVAAGWYAGRVQEWLGTRGILLLAAAMQVALIGILMLATHPLAIAFLLVRMVPGALSRPFLLAAVHPWLASAHRATYLSLQSLCGRLGLAASLLMVSALAPGDGVLEIPELQVILLAYVIAGIIVVTALAVTSRFLRETDSGAANQSSSVMK